MSTSAAKGGKHRAASGSKGKPTDKKKKRGFFRRFWWVFVGIPLIAILGFIGTIAYVYANTEIPAAPPAAQTTYVYDRDGHLLARFHAGENRTIIPFRDIPDDVKHAVIAIEDKDFYHEGGVSLVGILRAAIANVANRRIEQGGSTITQQYVKNVYTGSERTFGRKIREAILATKLARTLSKDEILSKYLNTVYFGNGAYGVQAAAQTYWGIPARELDTAQAATLAGLISAPETYDPVDHPDAAKERRDLVLTKMAEQRYITAGEAADLKGQELHVRKPKLQTSFPHAYFVDYVRRTLQSRYGSEATFSGGLRVTTTLDSAAQRAAEEAVANRLQSPDDPSAALVAIDPATGAVRALVGGRDFDQAKFNLALQARRQAGSAFKPFTLTAAVEQGISPQSVWSGPPSTVIPDPRCETNGKPWNVSNYADESAGTMTLVDATAHSVNTIFAQLVVQVGPDSVVDAAHRLGIQSDLQEVCSITLGTQPVTPLEMTTAYSTLAARGIVRSPDPLQRVASPDGEVLERLEGSGRRAVEENVADVVTNMLESVVERGTGTAANIGRPAAGKTGTAQNYVDAWFCGYTPQLAACVWMGYPKSEDRPMENVEGYSTVFGGSLPALIWHDFMTTALANVPPEDFPTGSLEDLTATPSGATRPSPTGTPTPSPTPSPTLPPTTPPSPSPSPSPRPSPSPSITPTPSISTSPP